MEVPKSRELWTLKTQQEAQEEAPRSSPVYPAHPNNEFLKDHFRADGIYTHVSIGLDEEYQGFEDDRAALLSRVPVGTDYIPSYP